MKKILAILFMVSFPILSANAWEIETIKTEKSPGFVMLKINPSTDFEKNYLGSLDFNFGGNIHSIIPNKISRISDFPIILLGKFKKSQKTRLEIVSNLNMKSVENIYLNNPNFANNKISKNLEFWWLEANGLGDKKFSIKGFIFQILLGLSGFILVCFGIFSFWKSFEKSRKNSQNFWQNSPENIKKDSNFLDNLPFEIEELK